MIDELTKIEADAEAQVSQSKLEKAYALKAAKEAELKEVEEYIAARVKVEEVVEPTPTEEVVTTEVEPTTEPVVETVQPEVETTETTEEVVTEPVETATEEVTTEVPAGEIG